MLQILQEHITKRLGKVPERFEEVTKAFEPLRLKRGTYLLREGDVCKYVYFIVEGCLQVFVIDKNGKEATRELYTEEHWVTDIFGFKNQQPSDEYIKCVEPCKLLRIHYDSFQHFSTEIPAFAQIYQQILELSYSNTVYRVNTLTSLDALERIKWLMENKPKLMPRLSSKLIASYLGVSPETMTRLKGKL
ncbi:Crp/Fnr family transcriptional regulator [Haliscomenobacter hydrossis]|uniref:Transcriptional regulator, Crp/Fnr family n=1 Tax=Haliscomenobacter hydrossis (strain ATCC 27775 / DSM 1100 / LMG 10767 / O) TaxID=760192 RepID=F4L8D3_HALH1|nr:Crp/Fnr family transcriptional regulator [Haliscomenobacter hydrossis]AEE54641.1 putative transcriptional regulator, Crp/Fnr family [Haliscomenobacter hydrossis DSM 1100]